jgi:hypothetical protein
MAIASSVMKLHLNYRLLIAEMNADISILRILEDYTKEMPAKTSEADVKQKMDYFKNKFILLRKEIDDQRNEMHVNKMKLFALTKQKKEVDRKSLRADNHSAIFKRFELYKKVFTKTKKEFIRFVGKNFD